MVGSLADFSIGGSWVVPEHFLSSQGESLGLLTDLVKVVTHYNNLLNVLNLELFELMILESAVN